MAEKTITTADYKLFPSPRNVHQEIFAHQVFVPYPYTLIDLPGFLFQGQGQPVCGLPAFRHEDGPAGDA